MHRTISLLEEPAGGARLRQEAAAWAAGLGFTLALFLGLARFENTGDAPAVTELAELRAVSLPLEPPPPPPPLTEVAPPAEPPLPLAGIEAGPSDSSVRIAVIPPELESLLPTTQAPPRARIQPGYVYTELKPRLDIETDIRRVYQVSEVDEAPRALVRVAPSVPSSLYGGARSLRLIMVVLINADGSVGNVRITKSSGQPVFDAAAVEVMQTAWQFSPAIRRGQKVKCLVQQSLQVNLPGASPFEIP